MYYKNVHVSGRNVCFTLVEKFMHLLTFVTYGRDAITAITRFWCQSTKLALIKLFPIIRAAQR